MNSIVAPFGLPIEERPPVPTLQERLEMREVKRKGKEERRTLRKGGGRIEESEGGGLSEGVDEIQEESGEEKIAA